MPNKRASSGRLRDDLEGISTFFWPKSQSVSTAKSFLFQGEKAEGQKD